MPEHVITYYSALVVGRSDRDEGRRRLRPLEEREPRWREAYESALRVLGQRDG